MTIDRAECLLAVINGDVRQFAALEACEHSELLDAARALDLVVTRGAVKAVVEAWLTETCGPVEVQRWASFVRRGYIGRSEGVPVLPIEIAYSPNDEELLVDIIDRLDQIGDVIEGEVDAPEKAAMIQSLS